jgi:hypothetical protein
MCALRSLELNNACPVCRAPHVATRAASECPDIPMDAEDLPNLWSEDEALTQFLHVYAERLRRHLCIAAFAAVVLYYVLIHQLWSTG